MGTVPGGLAGSPEVDPAACGAAETGVSPNFCYDLALKASNLQEREQIVRLLSFGAGGSDGLSEFERWRTERFSRLLGSTLPDEAFLTTAEDHREQTAETLTRFELGVRGFEKMGPAGRQVLDRIHSSWLPTYRGALEGFQAPLADPIATRASWSDPSVYTDRLARVAEPFLLHFDRILSRKVDHHNRKTAGLFGSRFLDGWHKALVDNFELMLAWAVEADTNVYCAQNHIDKQSSTPEQLADYFDRTFGSAAAFHAFYMRFPVLGRWLAHCSALACRNTCMVIDRLAGDRAAIGAELLDGKDPAFVSIHPGSGDPHAGGQSVSRIDVRVPGGQPAAIIYKPRPLGADAAVQRLLRALNTAGVVGFALRKQMIMDGYGYEEAIPSGRNRAAGRGDAERAFCELGGYLGLFHALGGGDLHFENLLIADGRAHVIDCEAALGVRAKGQQIPLDSVLDSVYSTGLLEWPRREESSLRLSGYGGGGSYTLPFPSPRPVRATGAMQIGVRNESDIEVKASQANRVLYQGRPADPADFRDSILSGFHSVYGWFATNRAEAAELVGEAFEGVPIRYVNWPTQIYAHLLVSLRHPRCLVDPLEVDSALSKLFRYRRKWDPQGTLAETEIRALWRLDVPIFSVRADSDDFLSDHVHPVDFKAERPPLEDALQRLERLSETNLTRQVQYIAASLPASGDDYADFKDSCVDYGRKVGDKLLSLMEAEGAEAPWRCLQLTPQGPAFGPIGSDLYGGASGLAMFLAYLDAASPDPRFRRAARRALCYAVENPPTRVGAFNGLSGVVYTALHLSKLWSDSELLDQAVRLARTVSSMVPADTELDVLGGAAGVIPVMLALEDLAPGEGLGCAKRSAQHLAGHAKRGPKGCSWPPADQRDAVADLTGFAHGTAGIGWALSKLAVRTDREDLLFLARQAVEYENNHFDQVEKDWFDLRASVVKHSGGRRHYANVWCNGSAGIGLARLASWQALDGAGLEAERELRDASLALGAVLRGFGSLGNDCLCHGRCGNAELILRYGLVRGEPAYVTEAQLHIQSLWKGLEQNQTLLLGNVDQRLFPGLMLGLAGYGLHCLRLADPHAVPSPLLLDPPPAPAAAGQSSGYRSGLARPSTREHALAARAGSAQPGSQSGGSQQYGH